MPMMARLHERFAHLIPELAKFGVVGLTGSIIDLGGAAYLHGAMGIGPLSAKAISITAATIVTYLGSRFWTFRHRVNQALLREGTLFVALNVIGLAIAEAVIAFTNYGLGFKSALAYNAAERLPIPDVADVAATLTPIDVTTGSRLAPSSTLGASAPV